MSSKPLPTQSLLELIDLFEQSGQPILDGDGQRLHGVPGSSTFGRTSLTAKQLEHWADCVGYSGSYPAPLGDDRVLPARTSARHSLFIHVQFAQRERDQLWVR